MSPGTFLVTALLWGPLPQEPAGQTAEAGHTMGQPAGAPATTVPPLGEVIDIDRRIQDMPALEDEPDLPPTILREGSVISRVLGRVVVERSTGAYVFVVDPEDALSPGHRLVLLPCSRLSELERIFVSATAYDLTFEVTGDVFVYHDRNYMLLTVPPLVIDHAPKPSLPAQDDDAGDPPAEAEAEDADSAESIISELERAVGGVAHRPESDATAERAASAGAQRLRAREGQTVVARRGNVRRSGGGAFVFVFDADATGRADPPLTILPCLLLEEIEMYLRAQRDDAPMLLNGRVYSYGRYDYIVPTVFRVPFERTKLSP